MTVNQTEKSVLPDKTELINYEAIILNTVIVKKVAGSIPAGVSGFFSDIKSFRSHNDPRVDSASNRNEYQEYFLGVKAADV